MTQRRGFHATNLWAILALAALATLMTSAAIADDSARAALVTPQEDPCAATVSIADLLAAEPSPGMSAETLDPFFQAQEAAPPFLRRTCRCSCGYPCKTDADCGPGGVCSPGITCC